MANMELIKKLREMTQAGVMDAKKALEENGDDLDKAAQWLREKGIVKAAKKASAVATEGVSKILIEGNKALVIEINSQTDFVAMSDKFIQLSNEITQAVLKANAKSLDEALKAKTSTGATVEEACTELTARIGEKTGVRRFEIVTKKDDEVFGHYVHNNNKIAVLLVMTAGSSEHAGHDAAMHAAAMNPKFLSQKDVDQKWLANETNILKEQTIAEGKPADKAEMIVRGRVKKMLAEVCLLDQPFFKDPTKTIDAYLKDNKSTIIKYIRYEVGEGIEKKQVDFAAEVAAQMGQN
ncbi:MAG: translation elongation factor Ts [Mycoplasmataceae bacterium]|jgi:elongation factor Ts|nr:translation elongation factor Ts [Mycoplasmataceae bacterium]